VHRHMQPGFAQMAVFSRVFLPESVARVWPSQQRRLYSDSYRPAEGGKIITSVLGPQGAGDGETVMRLTARRRMPRYHGRYAARHDL